MGELKDQNGKPIKIDQTNIAWPSDVRRYNNPKDYPDEPNKKGRSNTTWLYQLFPEVVSQKEGVKSEAFAAWMRPEALGRVWNHYGWVDQHLKRGTNISFIIENNFNATAQSSKFFVITERNVVGGRHTALGISLMMIGGVCLVFALTVYCGGDSIEGEPGM